MALARVCAVLVGVAVVLPATPAQAVTVTPSTRAFGAAIDAVPTWEREDGCDPTEKKGPRKLRRLLDSTYGHFSSNIARACSAADSGHEEGRALDWMVDVRVPEQREAAESFLAWLQASDSYGNPAAMARRLGVSYVIWDNAMWRPATGEWTPYSDCQRPRKRFKRFDTTCHRNHVHVSFTWDGALGRTSFYTGYVACPASESSPWPPAVLPPASGVVTVPATRVLGTRRGVGLPAGPCRAHPDVQVDVPVLGVGGVPSSGVSSVVLRVGLSRPDAPAELRVWTAGTALPAAPVLVTAKRTDAATEVTVPVGQDGLVSLQPAGGMGHLVVDLVGYTVGTTT